jgi:hypothetical protein
LFLPVTGKTRFAAEAAWVRIGKPAYFIGGVRLGRGTWWLIFPAAHSPATAW